MGFSICANDAMRVMLIGRGYLVKHEDFPNALTVAFPVFWAEQTSDQRKNRRLHLLLRLRHGPPPCLPNDVAQAVLDLATRDWWHQARDDEIDLAQDRSQAARSNEAAKANGVSKRTLYRAKNDLNIIAKKDNSTPDGVWTWRLPDGDGIARASGV